MSAERHVTRAHGLMLLYAFMISTSFTVGTEITYALPPSVLMFMRFSLASVIFWAVCRMKGLHGWPSLPDLVRYSVLAVCMTVFFIAMFKALRLATAVNLSALYTLMPLISAGFAWILLGVKMPRRATFLMVIAGLGAVWVIFDGSLARLLAFELGRGEWIFLIGVVAFGVYVPLVKKMHRGESALVMTFWMIVMTALQLGVISLPDLLVIDWMQVPGYVYLGVVYLAFFTTALTFAITQFAAITLPSAKVAAYTYLTPVFVVLTVGVIGQGWPQTTVIASLCVTVIATYFLQRSRFA